MTGRVVATPLRLRGRGPREETGPTGRVVATPMRLRGRGPREEQGR